MQKSVLFEPMTLNRFSTTATGVVSLFFPALLVLFLSVPLNSIAQDHSLDIDEILGFINERRSEGCHCGDTYFEATGPLIWDEELEEAALLHVKDMIVNDFFDHRNPKGESAASRIRNVTDRFNLTSENIARGQSYAIEVMIDWMNSPRHCANIMRPRTTHVGVAMRTGVEVENSHGITRPYWTMKLGRAIQAIDREIPEEVKAVPDAGNGIAFLDIDQDAVIEILNRVRSEGAYCNDDSTRRHSSDQVIDWHDDVAQVARERAKILVESNQKVARGEDRKLKRAWVNSDGLGLGLYIYEKASTNFEDALSNWLSDPYSCRRIMANSITFAGVGAAVDGSQQGEGAEGAAVYWVFMFVITTPESMKDEILTSFEGLDITVYGLNNCGRTKGLHRELNRFGVEHDHAFYENSNGSEPNRDKMHQAAARAERRVGNGRTLPYVIVDNTLFTGFGSAASLHRAVKGLE